MNQNISDSNQSLLLFSTPLFIFQNKVLVDNLRSYILSKNITSIDSNIAEGIKHNLSESKFNFFSDDNESIKKLIEFIASRIQAAVNHIQKEKVNYQIRFNESWFHVSRKNSTHEVHTHPGCSWCGIFCVESGDQNSGGDTVFVNPNSPNFRDLGTKFIATQRQHRIQQRTGQLVLFPSYLSHYQSLYTGDKERIVIAFNASLFGIVE